MRMRNLGWILGAVVVGAVVFAGSPVDQGKPGTQGAWPVTCVSGCSGSSSSDGGYLGTVGQGPSADGGLRWASELPAVIDYNNTTSTPLAGGATFTGTATYTRATTISVVVYANVASATDGLSIEFSMDGTNWDHTHVHSVAAATAFMISTTLQTPYYRVRYTNGATVQTTFRLQTMTRDVPSSGATVLLSDLPTNEDHAQVTQSVLVGHTTAGGGSFVDVKVNPSGALTVDATQATSPWVISGTVTATQGVGKDGGVWAWGTSPLSEGARGSAIPARATQVGMSDGTNLRTPQVVDLDTSGGGTVWGQISTVSGYSFGAASFANVEPSVPYTSNATGLYVWNIAKDVSDPVTTSLSCSSPRALIPGSPLTSRTRLTLKNNSDGVIYIGGTTLTAANGYPLAAGETWADDVSDATYYCLSEDAGVKDLRVLEN